MSLSTLNRRGQSHGEDSPRPHPFAALLARLELALNLLEVDRPAAAGLELAHVALELPGRRGEGHEGFDLIRRRLARGQVGSAHLLLQWFTQGFAGRVLH